MIKIKLRTQRILAALSLFCFGVYSAIDFYIEYGINAYVPLGFLVLYIMATICGGYLFFKAITEKL
jgi:hypothetical protein